jgi:hypothetical protein
LETFGYQLNLSIKVVSGSESGRQGRLMGKFYKDTDVNLQPYNPNKDKFLVIPIPYLSFDSGFLTRLGNFKSYKNLPF